MQNFRMSTAFRCVQTIGERHSMALAEYLHLYRIRPQSLSRSREHEEQGWRVRLKYAPENAVHYRKRSRDLLNAWYTVAVMELLVGERKSAREAAVSWSTKSRLRRSGFAG